MFGQKHSNLQEIVTDVLLLSVFSVWFDIVLTIHIRHGFLKPQDWQIDWVQIEACCFQSFLHKAWKHERQPFSDHTEGCGPMRGPGVNEVAGSLARVGGI